VTDPLRAPGTDEPYATVTPDRSGMVIVWLLGAIVAALLVGVAVWWTR
jgi:hypothetical protein